MDANEKFEPHEPRPKTVLKTPAGTPHPTLIFGERGRRETDKLKSEAFPIACVFEASAYVDDVCGGIFPKQEKNFEKITASGGKP